MRAEDNEFPSILVVEQGSTPANPDAGNSRLFVRDSDHVLCTVDDAGNVKVYGDLTNPMTTVGDLIRGGASGAPTRLAASATAGQFLMNGGAATAPAWASRELDYTEFTSGVSLTGTTEGTATTIVTANAITVDGSTPIIVEFFCNSIDANTAASISLLYLYMDGSSIGRIADIRADISTDRRVPVFAARRLTPASGSRTFSVRGTKGSGTSTANAGAGGSGNLVPGYIRIIRAV